MKHLFNSVAQATKGTLKKFPFTGRLTLGMLTIYGAAGIFGLTTGTLSIGTALLFIPTAMQPLALGAAFQYFQKKEDYPVSIPTTGLCISLAVAATLSGSTLAPVVGSLALLPLSIGACVKGYQHQTKVSKHALTA